MKYSVKATARATGITESRLRTWERRYGIPHPGRSTSGRRLYTELDLSVIRRMASFVSAGVPAAQAAEATRAEGDRLPPIDAPAQEEHPLAEEIYQAGMRYDEAAVLHAERRAVSSLGWARALDDVLLPALGKVGRAWGEDQIPSANEHFVTELVRQCIDHATLETPPAEAGCPSLLLACPEDERHEVGLLGLALLVRERGIRVYYLGADVPQFDLVAAILAVQPDGVCLASTLESSRPSLARVAREIIRGRFATRVFVGGPSLRVPDQSGGWPPGIRLPDRIEDAATLIVRTLKKEDS